MINVLYIFLGYILISLAIFQNFIFLACLFVLFFTFKFGAAYLLPLALFIDGYYGAFYNIPYFSMLMLVWFGLSELVRIRLRVM